jgi:hypothetical protein
MKYFLLLLLLPFFLHAQSEFIDSSSFAVKVGFDYSGNDNFTGRGADLSASIFGIFDLGLQYAYSETSLSPFKSSGNLYYIAFNSKRANSRNCIKILLGYVDETVTNEFYPDFRVTGPVAGLDLFLKVAENENVTFMPGLGVLYGFLSVDTKGIYNTSGFDDTRNIFLDLNFKVNLSNQYHFIITPSVSKDLVNSDNPLMLGIEVGFLINSIKGI